MPMKVRDKDVQPRVFERNKSEEGVEDTQKRTTFVTERELGKKKESFP